MKNTPLILSIVSLAGVVALACVLIFAHPGSPKAADAADGEGVAAGEAVYFNLDKVLDEYDMANDLRAVVGTKVESINQEVNRRGSRLEKDIKAFQDKIDKGLLTRSTAEIQSQKLQQQQAEFQQYAAQKQQEIAEEQSVMMNQLADAIKNFVDAYNAQMGYSLIFATQGDILPNPIVCADPALDITEDILKGLNEAYVKDKNSKK